jgi:hypothetical protein
MSTEEHPKPSRGPRGTIAKVAAAVAVVAVLAFGASQITQGGSSSATAAQGAQPGRFGNGTPPQMGAAVTGATLTKLKAAATARYPGTVEQAMKLPDGSYVVHVIQSSGKGEVHVLVSKDFKVTGVQQGGPPSGAAPQGTSQGSRS